MDRRVTEREFCLVSEVVFCSTSVDRHGDRLTKRALESVRDQILSDPDKRILRHKHDEAVANGEILDVYLEENDGIWYLKGEVGIFEGREEVKEQILSGELGGLSLTFRQYEGTTEEEWETERVSAKLRLEGAYREDLRERLKTVAPEFAVVIQKSATAPAIFEFATDNAELLGDILTYSFIWWLSKRSDGIAIEAPVVEFPKIDVTIDFSLIENRVRIGDVEEREAVPEEVREEITDEILAELEENDE